MFAFENLILHPFNVNFHYMIIYIELLPIDGRNGTQAISLTFHNLISKVISSTHKHISTKNQKLENRREKKNEKDL